VKLCRRCFSPLTPPPPPPACCRVDLRKPYRQAITSLSLLSSSGGCPPATSGQAVEQGAEEGLPGAGACQPLAVHAWLTPRAGCVFSSPLRHGRLSLQHT
jgi:hypothetical protein